MSTPNQPKNQTQPNARPEQTRPAQTPPGKPSAAPPPAQPPAGGGDQGLFNEPQPQPQQQQQQQQQQLPPLPVREPAAAEQPDGVPVPPWQRGGQQTQKSGVAGPNAGGQAPVQQEPQSSLGRPGHSPVAGRQQGAGAPPPPLPTVGTAAPARSVSDLAAKAARKEAAMVKSVGIDGPTRSIARPELVKDMPDLSELRHPTPTAEPVPPAAAVFQAAPQQRAVADPHVATVAAAGDALRATVQIRRIDPWTALKVSLVISGSLFFVWMIAVGLLYLVLAGMGVWDRLNSTFTDMVSESSSDGLISAGQVFWYAGLIGLVNVVLLTALSTIGTFIYNQCSDLVGGVQVTLADPD